MNTTFTKNIWRLMGIALLACLFQSRTAYSAAQVTVYTDQCVAGANFIEFRMMITMKPPKNK